MRIAVHGKDPDKISGPKILKLLDMLLKRNVKILISERFAKALKTKGKRGISTYKADKLPADCQAFISIGGDGTLLESVTHVGFLQIPILAINSGRLGFLATTALDEAEFYLDHLLEGKFSLDTRSVLRLETVPEIFGPLSFALNDFTLVKKDSSSMITIHTFIDGEFLNTYWADGIIVSTPTGSTGYSLSCGGPLIFPRSGNFVITPVSPHNLTVRPIIVNDSSVITFKIEGRSRKFLVSLDSRIGSVDANATLKITRAAFKVNLVLFEGQHYFKTLRNKLNWGLDIRN